MTTVVERVERLRAVAEEHDRWGRRDEAAQARAAAVDIERSMDRRQPSRRCFFGDCGLCVGVGCSHDCHHEGTSR